jgi:RNA polymerase sigma-70 factor (sigma-E family)
MLRTARDEEFSAFVVAHRVGLLRFSCLLAAGDTQLGEDLVQTALARLYVAWPRVRRTGAENAYARRIIVNAHTDEVRLSRRRRERSVADVPDDLPEVPAGRLPDSIDGDGIRAALAALPPRMRAAVVLRHWMDLSVTETAGLLRCSEGTVKSQTAKAIARLRELLSAPGPPLAADGALATEPTVTIERSRP